MARDDYVLMVEGLDFLEKFEDLPAEISRAASMALNKVGPWARTRSAEGIRREINFPAGYLRGQNSRLTLGKRASPDDLSVEITGRRRPTSLARFLKKGTVNGRSKGVRVQVKPNKTTEVRDGFIMKLRSGNDGALGNVGIAVRTKTGRKPDRAYKPIEITPGLYLLYGPSVDQVFKAVREDVGADVPDRMADEFNRLLDLKL